MELALEVKFYLDFHVHGDERWPMEVTSSTYFRWPTEVTSNAYFGHVGLLTPVWRKQELDSVIGEL